MSLAEIGIIGGSGLSTESVHLRNMDLEDFGLGASGTNTQSAGDAMARWIASHAVINAYLTFSSSLHLPL